MNVQETSTEDTTQQSAATQEAANTETRVAETQNEESTAAEQEEGATAQEQTEATQQDRDDKGRFKGVQGRIDELTRQRRETERERDYWRMQAEQGKAQTSAQAAPTKPTPDKFDDHNEYVEALTEFKAQEIFNKNMTQNAERQAAQVTADTFSERIAAFREQAPDFDAVVGGSTAPIAPHVMSELQESARGAELAYHFAKNPDALQALNGMKPNAAARELGRLEATLPAFKAAEAPPPVEKKITSAPPPAGTLGTQGRSTSTPVDKMSHDEYRAYRKTQGARWA